MLWQGDLSFDRNDLGMLLYLEDATFQLKPHHEALFVHWINTLLEDLELAASSATLVIDIQDCVLEINAVRVATSIAIDILFESIGGYYKYNRAVILEVRQLEEIKEALLA